MRGDERDSSPSSGIKTKGEIRPGSHWQLRVQAAMHTTAQIYADNKKTKKIKTNTQQIMRRKHANTVDVFHVGQFNIERKSWFI